MNTKFLHFFLIALMISITSCKKKSCPAYNTPEENQKLQEKEMKKSSRRGGSSKLF